VKTKLEKMIELEDTVRAAVKERYPEIDADWAVEHYLDRFYDNNKKLSEILAAMVPEIVRSQRITGELK
jgi:hypothetical protein